MNRCGWAVYILFEGEGKKERERYSRRNGKRNVQSYRFNLSAIICSLFLGILGCFFLLLVVHKNKMAGLIYKYFESIYKLLKITLKHSFLKLNNNELFSNSILL